MFNFQEKLDLMEKYKLAIDYKTFKGNTHGVTIYTYIDVYEF